MKRFVLIFILIVLGYCSSIFSAENAVDKGSKIISLNGYFLYQTGDLYDTGNKSILTTYVSPSLFFFTSKNFYIGPEFLFYNQSIYNSQETQVGIGPRIGFILNPAAAENEKSYALYYFSIFTTFTRVTTSQTIYGYSYDGSYRPYDYETKSNKLSYGLQIGSYNMVQSHFALDFNLRLFADKNNRENSTVDKTGFTIMLGFGVVGFSF